MPRVAHGNIYPLEAIDMDKAAQYRTKAREFRRHAIPKFDRRARQALMLRAIRAEAVAEEIERLDAEDESSPGLDIGLRRLP